MGQILSGLGRSYYDQRQYEQAAATLKEAIAMLEQTRGADEHELVNMRATYKKSLERTRAGLTNLPNPIEQLQTHR